MRRRLFRRVAAASWERGGLVGAVSQVVMVLIIGVVAIPVLFTVAIVVIVTMGAIMFAIASIAVYVVAYVSTLFPACSAQFYVKERDTAVMLEFYELPRGTTRSEDDASGSLTVRTPEGTVTQKICGGDWTQQTRTSVYLFGDHDLAVVGPHYCDYVISTRPMAVSAALSIDSRNWIYLGAFDLVDDNGRPARQRLRFIPAGEEEECIEGRASLSTVRNGARRDSCSAIHHRRP